jgi:translation initiation factor 2 alpha subunit (eIF-2alpha)
MKKYTLYQASTVTKITRYKLEKAIEEGLLEAIPGKGNIKHYILKEALDKFMEEHGDQFKRFDLNERNKENTVIDQDKYISRELHDEILKQNSRLIDTLQGQVNHLMSLLQGKNELKEKTPA